MDTRPKIDIFTIKKADLGAKMELFPALFPINLSSYRGPTPFPFPFGFAFLLASI